MDKRDLLRMIEKYDDDQMFLITDGKMSDDGILGWDNFTVYEHTDGQVYFISSQGLNDDGTLWEGPIEEPEYYYIEPVDPLGKEVRDITGFTVQRPMCMNVTWSILDHVIKYSGKVASNNGSLKLTCAKQLPEHIFDELLEVLGDGDHLATVDVVLNTDDKTIVIYGASVCEHKFTTEISFGINYTSIIVRDNE